MTIFKKITAVFVGIIISFTVAFGGQFSNAIRTSAEDIETTANFFDNTSVDEDLKGIDLSSYVVNENKSPEIVRVDEYCFAHSLLNCENYGLYLYVYNPFDVSISERTGANIVNIATSYTKNEAGEYKATEYDNLPLKYCNVSESGRIIKFRVQDDRNVLLSNAREQNSDKGERRYDIAGVQLWELGAGGAMEKEWRIATTYYFSGYAKGYGADENEESTLTVHRGNLETLQLKPQFTNYRMSSEYDSVNHLRYEVNSSYFVIPERYINDYGKLQKIHAQWYEYKTSPIFTTNDDNVELDKYNGKYLRSWIGVDIGEYNKDVGWQIYDYSIESNHGKTYNIGYNTNANPEFHSTTNLISRMAYLFCDRWTENYQDVVIPKEELEDWIKNYCEKYNRPADIALNGAPEYSSDLFAESIEDYRLKLLKENQYKTSANWTATRGLVEVNIDADQEKETLLSYADTHNDWDNFWADFFGNDIFTNSHYSYAPIQPITMQDLNLSKTEFCDKFLVNSQDYQTFYDTCYEALKEDSDNPGTPYVFRYAQTDYFSVDVKFDQENLFEDWFYGGYIAQETVFLNFDYIDFTFRSEKKGDTVIPVVMDPVDVINAVTHGGTQEKDPANWLPYAIVITLVCVATLAVTIFAKKELRR